MFVILLNRQYRVLKHNVDVWRQNFEVGTQHPYQHMDLARPQLDFVHLAAGMGIEGISIEKADGIAPALASAVAIASRSDAATSAWNMAASIAFILSARTKRTSATPFDILIEIRSRMDETSAFECALSLCRRPPRGF